MADMVEKVARATAEKCEYCGSDLVDKYGRLFCLECGEYPCLTCRGSGYINPLTSPPGHLCLGSEECPSCEGTGNYD